MSVQKKIIREALRVQLTANIPGLVAQKSRHRALKKGDFPAVIVYTPKDTVDQETQNSAPRELLRNLTIRVEILTNQGNDGGEIEDALDDLCQSVENALGKDDSIGGSASDAMYEDTETDVLDDGETLIGLSIMTFTAQYYSVLQGDDSDLDDLKEIHTTWNLGAAQAPAEQAKDILTGLNTPEE